MVSLLTRDGYSTTSVAYVLVSLCSSCLTGKKAILNIFRAMTSAKTSYVSPVAIFFLLCLFGGATFVAAVPRLEANVTASNTTCTGFDAPMTVGDDIFGLGAPAMECPRVFECTVTYCLCVGGDMGIRNERLGCANASAGSDAIRTCTRQRSLCLLYAGLDAATRSSEGVCAAWGERMWTHYALWTTRQPSSALFPACQYAACSTIAEALPKGMVSENEEVPVAVAAGNFTVEDIRAMCAFSFPYQNVWNSTLFTSSSCGEPVMDPTILPVVASFSMCPAVETCLVKHCECLGSGSNCTGGPTMMMNEVMVNSSVWNRCVPLYAECVTVAAVNTTTTVVEFGSLSSVAESCLLWSLGVTQDYSLRLYRPLADPNMSQVIAAERANCLSVACALISDTALFHETSPARDAACAAYNRTIVGSELPFPYPDGVSCSQRALEATSPIAPLIGMSPLNCSAIKICSQWNFCACLSGNASMTRCDPAAYRGERSDLWIKCSAEVLSCVVNYVLDNRTSNFTAEGPQCVAWAANVSAAYSTWYYASIRSKSTLHSDCLAASCETFGSFRPLALLAPDVDDRVCSFANVTTVPPRTPCPSYTCPDRSCAPSPSGCACAMNASIIEATMTLSADALSIQSNRTLEFGTSIVVRVNALYRVPSAVPCGNFDFSEFLMYEWTLTRIEPENGTALASPHRFNGSSYSASFASSLMERNSWYNLTVRIATFFEARDVVLVSSFRIVDPIPIVSIVLGGTRRRVSSNGFSIPALVQDPFLNSSAFRWSCANATGGSCPLNLSSALTTNGTLNGVDVRVYVTAGVWLVTLTYKEFSSTLELTVVSFAIPDAQIVIGGTPVYMTQYFIASQSIPLAAAVSFAGSGALTYQWSVNGVVLATTSTLKVAASSLLLSTSTSVVKAIPNVVTLRATSISNAEAYGEASVLLYAAAAPSLAIVSLTNRFFPNRTNATALTDSLSIQVASNIVNSTAVTFGQPAVLQTSFFLQRSGGDTSFKKTPLYTTTANINTNLGTVTRTIIEAPLPNTRSASSVVIFTVDLTINGVVVVSTNRTFPIVLPTSLGAAVSIQKNLLATFSDPISAAPTIVSLSTLMQLSTNATEVADIAASLLASMLATVVNGSLVPSDVQGMYIESLLVVVTTVPTSALTTTRITQVVGVVGKFVESKGTFSSSDNGLATMQVLSVLPATAVIAVVGVLAVRVAESTSAGETTILSTGTLTVAAMQETASNFPAAVLRSSRSEMAVPLDFVLPGTAPATSSKVAIVATESTSDPFPAVSASVPAALSSSVVNFRVLVNNQEISVQSLSKPLVFNIKSTSAGGASCWYYDTILQSWRRDGIEVVGVTGDEVTCTTSHLTSFAAFSAGSSAAGVALSALVVAVSIVVQLCAHLVE